MPLTPRSARGARTSVPGARRELAAVGNTVVRAGEAPLTPRRDPSPRSHPVSGRDKVVGLPPLNITTLNFPSRLERPSSARRPCSAPHGDDLLARFAPGSARSSSKAAVQASPRLDWREITPRAPLEQENASREESDEAEMFIAIFVVCRHYGLAHAVRQNLRRMCTTNRAPPPIVALATQKSPKFLSGGGSTLTCMAQHRCVVASGSELLLLSVYTQRGAGVYADNAEGATARDMQADIMLIRVVAEGEICHKVHHARARMVRQENDVVTGTCLAKECSFRPWPHADGTLFNLQQGSAFSRGRTWIVIRAEGSATSPLLHAVGLRELQSDIWLHPAHGSTAWAQLPGRRTSKRGSRTRTRELT